MFGSNHLYVFRHPDLYKANPKNYTQVITYEMAQGEIAAQSGFDMGAKPSTGKSKTGRRLVINYPLLISVPLTAYFYYFYCLYTQLNPFKKPLL